MPSLFSQSQSCNNRSGLHADHSRQPFWASRRSLKSCCDNNFLLSSPTMLSLANMHDQVFRKRKNFLSQRVLYHRREVVVLRSITILYLRRKVNGLESSII